MVLQLERIDKLHLVKRRFEKSVEYKKLLTNNYPIFHLDDSVGAGGKLDIVGDY